MADDSARVLTAAGDQIFLSRQNQLRSRFASDFESWASRVISQPPLSDDAKGFSLTDLMQVTPAVQDVSRVSSLVWDLAKLCRDFILDDVSTWGFYLKRCEGAAGGLPKLLIGRANDTQRTVKEREWREGLDVLGPYRFPSMFDADGEWVHGSDAWRTVVEESMLGVIPSLARTEPDEGAQELRSSLANRDRVDDFKRRFLLDTGEKISTKELARISGYKSDWEFQAFMRSDKALGKAALKIIETTLGSSMAEVLQRLTTQREKSKKSQNNGQ